MWLPCYTVLCSVRVSDREERVAAVLYSFVLCAWSDREERVAAVLYSFVLCACV